jgi:hypothetical protein
MVLARPSSFPDAAGDHGQALQWLTHCVAAKVVFLDHHFY